MDYNEFSRILTTFADNSSDYDYSKGDFVVNIRGELIQGSLQQRSGELLIKEVDTENLIPANIWLIQRVARIQQMADRLLSYIPEEPFFVNPSGEFLDTLDSSKPDSVTPVDNVALTITENLARRPAGTTSLCYLTSDAGEGKTTLINQIAPPVPMMMRQ